MFQRLALGEMAALGATGLPLLVRTLSLRAAIPLTVWAATALGATELAAHQVVSSLWGFAAFALDALAIAAQALVGVLVALAAWVLTGRQSAAWSAGYGALAVVIPAALFARGVMRHKNRSNPGVAMLGFFGWEMVKIVLTVAMLVAAPRVVGGLSWLALIAGMVLAMKTYWIALVVQSRRSKLD